MDVDRRSATTDGHRELLPRKMGCADLRSGPDVTKAHRVGGRAEVKCAAKEYAVDRAGDRSSVSGDGRKGQQAHPDQLLRQLLGRSTAAPA